MKSRDGFEVVNELLREDVNRREALRMLGWSGAALAGAAGIQMSSHLYPEVSAHLLRVAESGHWLEWQDWAHPVLAAPFQLEDGHLIIPEVPGNGLAWDEDAVRRYRL